MILTISVSTVAVAIILIGGNYWYRPAQSQEEAAAVFLTLPNKDRVNVELADTPAKRARGLSGRKSLAADKGMLFIFPQADYHSFWMKEMRFPIDIIWLDTNWKVVDIRGNLQPESFPASYAPSQPALYVLELPAGTAAKRGVEIGTKLEF